MSLDEMLRAKNTAILELRRVNAQGDSTRIRAVARRAAELEEQIAEHYLSSGKHEDAVVNLISQASCLQDAGDLLGAVRVLQRARSLTKLKPAAKWIDEQLSNSQRRTQRGPQVGAAGPLHVFVSYSHRDEKFRDELEKHLAPLKRSVQIETWLDRKVLPGVALQDGIDRLLETSDIVLLLVSADFVASDYCYKREMQTAINRHNAGQARVIPIITTPVDWRDTPIGQLLALPKDGKPVTAWPHRDKAMIDVARGIRQAVKERLAAGSVKPAQSASREKRGAIRRQI